MQLTELTRTVVNPAKLDLSGWNLPKTRKRLYLGTVRRSITTTD